MFDKNILIKAIQSDNINIAMWGAFRLIQENPSEIEDYLPYLLNSPFEDIVESAISKIAELNSQKFIPLLIKIFREEEGRLKYAAALTLSQFPNDFSKNLIEKWFYQTINNSTSTSLEFEAAIFSFIKINKQKNFSIVIDKLELIKKDSLKSSLVISDLLKYCETVEEYSKILDGYFIARDEHSDADLTQKLVERFGKQDLIEWLIENVSKGYSILSIYQQCYKLLGFAPNEIDIKCWESIEKTFQVDDKLQRFTIIKPDILLNSLINWVDQLTEIDTNSGSDEFTLKQVLIGYAKNKDKIVNTIPKILELELFFLLTIPLIIILDQCVKRWTLNPAENLENIAKYYHSSLLLSTHREKILNLFFPNLPNWSEDEVQIHPENKIPNLSHNKNEIAWQFNRGGFLGLDISWHSVFPNPNFSRNIYHGLFLIYYYNFDYYIRKQDRVAVDYALQMFNSYPKVEKDEIHRLLDVHFDYLSLHHSELLYQLMETIPDVSYIPKLLSKYKSEEFELVSRIAMICEIYDQPIPPEIEKDLDIVSNTDQWRLNQRIRLSCESCQNTYRYSIKEIFVDETAVLKATKIDVPAIWIPNKFECKNCDSELAFNLDNQQLEEISIQARVERIIKTPITSQNKRFRFKITLIDFPRFKGSIYNPETLENLIDTLEKDRNKNKSDLKVLYKKQILLYRNMQNWEKCNQVLKKLEPEEDFYSEWMFLKGLANYKLGNFADSRINFSELIQEAEARQGMGFESFWEQAKYFCKILDSEKSKRKRFKVIGGGK